RMRAEVTELLQEGRRVVGVLATTPNGPLKVHANLVVAADGRHSIVREKAGLRVKALGAPMDVLWFRLSRTPGDPTATMGRFDVGDRRRRHQPGDSGRGGRSQHPRRATA